MKIIDKMYDIPKRKLAVGDIIKTELCNTYLVCISTDLGKYFLINLKNGHVASEMKTRLIDLTDKVLSKSDKIVNAELILLQEV